METTTQSGWRQEEILPGVLRQHRRVGSSTN